MKHSDYFKKKRTRETRRKIISVISAIVVFITAYTLVLPALTLDVSKAGQEPGIAFEQMLYKTTVSAASVTAADGTVEEVQVEEPAAEEPGEEETIQEETAESSEEETSAASDGKKNSPEEPGQAETPAGPEQEKAPAAEAETEEVREDKSADTNPDAASASEPESSEEQTADTQKAADQAAVDQSGSGTTDAAAAATAEAAAEFRSPVFDALDFDDILTDKTDFYYYHPENAEEAESLSSDSIDNWKKAGSDTVLAPEDFVRVYLSYEIPAGALNETNTVARYRLPADLELSDRQIKAINKYENGIAASRSGSEHDKYLGAEAIEGSRTPDEKADDEYISATVRVEKTPDDRQELVFTFIPYTVEKNRISYDEKGNVKSKGKEVKGFFTFDLMTSQIDFDKTDKETAEKEDGTTEEIQFSKAEVVFVKENNEKNIDEISRTLTLAAPAEKEEKDESLTQEQKNLTSEGSDYTVTVSYTEAAQIPDHAELAVREIEKGTDEYASYLEQAKGAVDENKSVNEARFFDITILADGEKIEPQAPVSVQINFAGIEQTNTDDTQLLHYKDDEEVEVMDQAEFSKSEESGNEAKAVDTVQFETDGFSVYGIVGTETIEGTYLTADGETYKITVTYGPEAEIPEGAVLEVSELPNDNKDYTDYVEKAAKALAEGNETPFVNAARLFDISIKADGKTIEPKAPVEVKIEYANAENLNETSAVGAVHFKKSFLTTETEVLDVDVQGEEGKVDGVTFTTDSFSIYAVIIIDQEEGTFVVEDENYKVTITYTKEADISPGTVMTVRQIEYDTAEYWDLWKQTVDKINEGIDSVSELQEDPRKGLTDAVYFDISLEYEGKEFEPKVPLQVSIDYLNDTGIAVPADESVGVIHFGKDGTEIISDVNTSGEEAVSSFSYLQNGFSLVGTYSTGKYTDPDSKLIRLPGALSPVKAVGGGDEVGTIVASKNLDPNDDGTYTLKLNVTGQEQSATSSSVTKSNVVIVVDVSGSMNDSAGRGHYSRSAEYAYQNTSGMAEANGRSYKTGTAYYTSTNGYTRVYPTFDGNTYKWATLYNNRWTDYTGSVFTDMNRLEATKNALFTLVEALLANNKNETITDKDGNVISISDTIEITLIKFANKYAYYYGQEFNDTQTLIRNAVTAGSPSSSNTLEGAINDLTAAGGTNWESALQLALTEANAYKNASSTDHAGTEADPITTMADETTSVIFFTDGLPTLYVSGDYDGGNGEEERDNVLPSWNNARDEAKEIVDNGFTMYNIFAFGADRTPFNSDTGATGSALTPSDYLKSMTNYAYGVPNDYSDSQQYRNNITTSYTSDYFFDASNTEKLQQAFEKIIHSISNHVAFGGVDVHDGVSFGATNSTILLNEGTINPASFTYTVSTGTTVDYTVRVNSSGEPVFTFGTGPGARSYTGTTTQVQVPDPADPNNNTVERTVYSVTVGSGDDAVTYVMPPANLYSKTEEGVTRQGIEWDLTGVGTLKDGQSYELSSIVWPNQAAYDLIAEMNNGHITKEQAASMDEYKDIVPYIEGTKETGYTLSTNWEQYVDYYRVESETDENNNTTYNYIEQDPVLLTPGKATLSSTRMFMNKVWNDSLDPSQIAKVLEKNPNYQVYLRIWKADTEDELLAKAAANADNYDQRITLGWQEGTDAGTFLWTKDYTVAPGVMVKEGDTAAENIGLTKENHEGYRLAKYNGDYYFILEEGHYYTVTEENIDDHFILEEHVYHPMVVNGVVSDVAFNGVLEDDPYGAIDVESVYTMTSVDATNTLRGGINITKVVKDSDGEEVESDQVFVAEVTLTAPMKDGVPDFTNVENYYADDNVTVLIPSVAWYRYYDREGNVVYDDALIDAGILEDSGQTTEFGRVGQGENYDGSGWFYLDFDDSTGTVTGNVKLVTQYTLRFTNMATGTQYDLTETGTNGMTPSYSFTHRTSVADGEGNFEDDITPDGDTHFVEGNAESNIEVTNTGKWIPLFIYKFGGTDVSEIDNKLAGVQFKLYSDADLKVQVTKDARGTAIGTDGLITTGEDGTASLGELNPGTYYLVETGLGDNDGYKMLTDAVVIEIGDPIHYEQIGWSPSVQYSSASDPSNLVKANGGLYINYAEDGTTISGYTFTINNKAGVELPMTGGPGTLPYTLGGLMLILGTALLYAFTFRKRSK